MFEFSGKVVAITGGAAGIGAALCEAFQQSGATLAVIDRSEAVEDFASTLGKTHRGYRFDLEETTAIPDLFRKISMDIGNVDILVNNAGIGSLAPALEMSEADWNRALSINLTASFFCAKAVGGAMMSKGWGRIISIASQAAIIGIEDHVAYSASKAGLLGMTHCLALEWGPYGVTANCVSPTVVETQLALKHWGGEAGERARAAIPARRFARPDEVASAVLYLASSAASMVNGANLVLDGGYTIR